MWTPILDGQLARQALEAVQEIAATLRHRPPARRLPGANAVAQAIEGASLAGGRAGLAIFYTYLARAGLGDNASKVADELMDQAVEALAKVSMPPSLYKGFAGVAWAVTHLRRDVEAPDDEDQTEEIDIALRKYLQQSPWSDHYDLVGGLVGAGVYALERFPRRSARDLISLVLRRLDDIAERTMDGLTWFSRPALLPDHRQKSCPKGHYNLGVAHGVPGVIALLGSAHAAGVAPAKTRRMLEGAVQWLLANRLPEDRGSTFPFWTAHGSD